MIFIGLLEDYLVDQEDDIKKVLTWFLNLIMHLGKKFPPKFSLGGLKERDGQVAGCRCGKSKI